MQETISKSGSIEFPLPTMSEEEVRALKTCIGTPLSEDEIQDILASIAGVIPIPGGALFRLRNGQERMGGNLNYV